jgi:hypothetical protein
METQVRLWLAGGDPAFVIKQADEKPTIVIERLDASIASRSEGNQRSIVVGPGFFLSVIQLGLAATLTAALKPLVKETDFTIIAGKQSNPVGRIEFKSVNFATEARAAILMCSAPISVSSKQPPSLFLDLF